MAGSRGSHRRSRPPHGAPASGSLYERYKDALRRGHVAALRGRNDAAVDAYAEAAMIAPDRALPHVSVGATLAKMNRLDDAVDAYERALALAPRDEGALRGIADVHARAGRRADAADALDRLADSLDAAGRLADATDAARRALELAESRSRRQHVEGLAGRLRASSTGDEAAQRALDEALRVLAPTVTPVVDQPIEEPADTRAEAAEDLVSADADRDAAAPAHEAEPAELAEPAGLGIALGALAEAALHAGDPAAREHLLAAARAHRRAGRTSAALDACDLAIAVAPSDPDIHLLLADLYLDRGWRLLAVDKLLLLGRLAELDDDTDARDRICELVRERLPDEQRVAGLCA